MVHTTASCSYTLLLDRMMRTKRSFELTCLPAVCVLALSICTLWLPRLFPCCAERSGGRISMVKGLVEYCLPPTLTVAEPTVYFPAWSARYTIVYSSDDELELTPFTHCEL